MKGLQEGVEGYDTAEHNDDAEDNLEVGRRVKHAQRRKLRLKGRLKTHTCTFTYTESMDTRPSDTVLDRGRIAKHATTNTALSHLSRA